MASLTEVLRIARTTRNAFNYWRRARLLSTRFKKTKAGVPGDLSRANALEVAFMAAFIATGFSPKLSKEIVKKWMEAEAIGKLPPLVAHIQYSANFTNRPAILGVTDETDIDQIAYRLGAIIEEGNYEHWKEQANFGTYVTSDVTLSPSATAFAVIRLAEIVRRVDELFPKATDRGSS